MSLADVYSNPFDNAPRAAYSATLKQSTNQKDRMLGEVIALQLEGRDTEANRILKMLGSAALGTLKRATSLKSTIWSRGFPASCRLKRVGLKSLAGLEGFATLIHLDIYQALIDGKGSESLARRTTQAGLGPVKEDNVASDFEGASESEFTCSAL